MTEINRCIYCNKETEHATYCGEPCRAKVYYEENKERLQQKSRDYYHKKVNFPQWICDKCGVKIQLKFHIQQKPHRQKLVKCKCGNKKLL